MKALTICQPYAHLIAHYASLDDGKLVENRTGATHYRGPLIIHAGKSKSWLDSWPDDFDDDDLVFGAAIGIGRLVGCVHIDDVPGSGIVLDNGERLEDHQHTEGKYCWILADVHPLKTPYPCKGAQGLWNLPVNVVRISTDGVVVNDDKSEWADDDIFELEAA